MDWEPQEYEFVNHDRTTIVVKVAEDGCVEVTYLDYDTAVTQHATETWNDAGRAYTATVTTIRPGRHIPGVPAGF